MRATATGGFRFRWVACLMLTFGVAGANSAVSGQDPSLRIKSVHGTLSRVVFPAVAEISQDEARTILNVLAEERDIPGLPTQAGLADRYITVSLAIELPPGVDGWSDAASGTMILPARRWVYWEPSKLRRVLRHELAHLAMESFLEHREMPHWFHEGFAEWASGGLTCEGRARLGIETLRRLRNRERLPGVDDVWDSIPGRLAYDVFASFFEFLSTVHSRGLPSGALIQGIHDLGLESALVVTYGAGLRELEKAWRQWLRGQYSEGLVLAGCHQEETS